MDRLRLRVQKWFRAAPWCRVRFSRPSYFNIWIHGNKCLEDEMCASKEVASVFTFAINCGILKSFISVRGDSSSLTCDEGTWVHPDRWGYGASSVLVGLEFCWTQSYFCGLKGRTPVAEEREREEKKTREWAHEGAETKSRNQLSDLTDVLWQCASVWTMMQCYCSESHNKGYVQRSGRNSLTVLLDDCSPPSRELARNTCSIHTSGNSKFRRLFCILEWNQVFYARWNQVRSKQEGFICNLDELHMKKCHLGNTGGCSLNPRHVWSEFCDQTKCRVNNTVFGWRPVL